MHGWDLVRKHIIYADFRANFLGDLNGFIMIYMDLMGLILEFMGMYFGFNEKQRLTEPYHQSTL